MVAIVLLAGCSTQGTQELASPCVTSVRSCTEILEAKYSASTTVLKEGTFTSHQDAELFYNQWKGLTQLGLDFDLGQQNGLAPNTSAPVTLVALRITGAGGTGPVVVVCDSSGALTRISRVMLFCG